MRTLYWFEMKMFLRDSRTIFYSIILPVLLMPILFRSVQGFQQRKNDQGLTNVYTYVLVGPFSEPVRELLKTHSNFKEFSVRETPLKRLKEGFFDLVIETYDTARPRTLESGSPQTADSEPPVQSFGGAIFGARDPGRPGLWITYVSDHERSRLGKEEILTLLNVDKRKFRDAHLENVGVKPDQYLKSEFQDIATEQSRAGNRLAPILPLILVFLVLGGASVAAVDCLAGERERGTLETLLTSCLPQSSIIIAKQLAVLSLAVLITLFELANMLLYIKLGWIQGSDYLDVHLGVFTYAVLALLGCTLALTISSLLLFVSATSQNFKEAQLALFPALIVCIALTGGGTLPELRLNSAVAVVPLTSIAVAIREQLTQSTSWLGLTICIFVHLAVSAWLVWASRSKLIPQGDFRSLISDSVKEQKRNYLRGEIPWVYALTLAAIFIVPSNFPALLTLAGQVSWNQGLMVVVPAALLLRHGIKLKEGFRFNPVSVKVVVAALLLAPLVQLCAQSTVWATGEFFPVPEEMLKQMSRMILPDSEPTWKLVLLIALSPAICEELAFRGALLYSLTPGGEARMPLRRKLRISLVVGLIFGIFHLTPSRILPVGVTGFFITLLALETGSVIPGMLVHFGNNALAVVAERSQLDLGAMPPWVWLASWAGIFLIFLWLRKGAAKGT